eukprot:GFUD01073109.1.p1 GENE.GFUD01073109.1~~GFUD01073109.1.p1  ORF type:complete len:490 (-),score=79.48 GFUD01073109.1:300-1769(-)
MEKRWLLFTLLLCTRGSGEPPVTTEHILSQNSVQCLDDQLTSRLLPFLPQIKATWETVNGQFQIRTNSKSNIGWICQKAKDSTNKRTQFITMYDVKNMLPVYSAYIALPWTFQQNQWTTASFKKRSFENVGNPTMKVGKWGDIPISNYESYTGTGLDRGHLFAAQYATDEDQNKATYRLTNTVPQDSDFNKNQWKKAETYMKDYGFKKCQISGGTPFVFTGAITGFQEQKYQITKANKPNDVEMSIPTHMWTTMLCVDLNNNDKISLHLSFIGSNYQKGLIIFYKNFLHFGSDLKLMYKMQDDLFSTPAYNGMNHENTLSLEPPCFPQDGSFICTTDKEVMYYWKNTNVAEQRALNLFDQFSYSMRLSGYGVDAFKAQLVNAINRNKREITTPSNSDEAKLSFMLVMINDTHSKHDLELRKFELTEVDEKTRMPVDQYTVNLNKIEYVEENPGGTEVKFSYQEDDGKEKAIEKVQSATRKINIILTPRN